MIQKHIVIRKNYAIKNIRGVCKLCTASKNICCFSILKNATNMTCPTT